MTIYDYNTFVYPVPEWYVIPKLTQVRSVVSGVETFFTTQYDLPAGVSNAADRYLDHDVTRMKPKPLEEINTVIYNLRTAGGMYPVAVCQGGGTWSAFTPFGGRMTIYTHEIERFDTAPLKGY